MNSLSTATMEREAGKIPQITDVHNGQTISLDWTPHTFKQTESDLWTLLIALASNDDEDGMVALTSTLRRLRELGAQLVATPDVERAPTPKIRLTAGGMPERDYQVVRGRHLMPHAARVADLLKTVAFAAADPLTRAAIESGARVEVVGI